MEFSLLKFVAGFGEGPANEQKCTTDGNIEKVKHGCLLRLGENDLVASLSQLSCQPLLTGERPRIFTAAEHDDRLGVERACEYIGRIAAKI